MKTKRTRVLEKLDELRDSLVVFEEVVGEMKETRKIVQRVLMFATKIVTKPR